MRAVLHQLASRCTPSTLRRGPNVDRTVAADGRAISVTVDPSGKFAYVADGGQNSDGSKGTNVSMLPSTPHRGLNINRKNSGGIVSFLDRHPCVRKFVYVVNYDSNDISMYTMNTTTGNLTSIEHWLRQLARSSSIHRASSLM